MLPGAIYRLPDHIFVGLFTAAFLTFLVAVLPNYQKSAYANTKPVDYEEYEEQAGYPAGEGFPEITSVLDLETYGDKNFVVTVDAQTLTPLDFYGRIQKDIYKKSGLWRALNNNDSGGIGRYFTVALESGERVVIFLDDTSLRLPKEGKITLPIGRKIYTSDNFSKELQEQTNLSEDVTAYYLDMAGIWRSGKEAKQVENMRILGGFILFVVLWTGLSYILKKLMR